MTDENQAIRNAISARVVKEVQNRLRRVISISGAPAQALAGVSLQLLCSDQPPGSKNYTFSKKFRVAYLDVTCEPPETQVRHVHSVLRQAVLDYHFPREGQPRSVTLLNGNSPYVVTAMESFARSLRLGVNGGDPIAGIYRWERKRLIECKNCIGAPIAEMFSITTNIMHSLADEDWHDVELANARRGIKARPRPAKKEPDTIGDPALHGCRKCFDLGKPHWNCCYAAIAGGVSKGTVVEGIGVKCCAPWNLPEQRK